MAFNLNDENKKRAAQILGGILGMAVGGAVGYGIGEGINDALTPDTPMMGENPNGGPQVIDGQTSQPMDNPRIGHYRAHYTDGSTGDIYASSLGLTGTMADSGDISYKDPGEEALFEGENSNFNGILDGDITGPGKSLINENFSGHFSSSQDIKDVDYFEYIGENPPDFDNPFDLK